jgi:serine/threonine protein phosphatase 1
MFHQLVPANRPAYQARPMIASLRQLFRPRPQRPPPAVPPGQRVYAIGDIHGRRDLFAALIEAIDADDAASGAAETTVVLLGDLVDRGADSAGVIAATRAWAERRRVRWLIGNHEECFLAALEDEEGLRAFLRIGGRETALSYPLDAAAFARADLASAAAMIRGAVPEEDIAFLRSGEDRIVIGDYLFVHAGIRPGLSLAEQSTSDLRWIRGEFTGSRAEHQHCVVHGHTITDTVDIQPNSIGIDTGAYYSGVLTALRLEGTRRGLLQTVERDGGIAVATRSIE